MTTRFTGGDITCGVELHQRLSSENFLGLVVQQSGEPAVPNLVPQLGEASLEGRRLQFLGWIGVTLISLPLIFYGCMVLAGGAFGLIMAARGKFTTAEVKNYALYGEFPQYWYREDA